MTALTQNAIIGVIGAGTMGAGIAQVAATAGHKVLLFDTKKNVALAGLTLISKGLQKLVDRHKIDENAMQAILDNITVAVSLSQLSACSMVIEAIIENLAIKQQLFQELEMLCNDDTILASNTSSLSLTAIGSSLQRPERLAGMHFFNPAPVMKLVEVISSLATAAEVAETVSATASAWGKKPVNARSTPGFIVNRVARPFYAEGLRVLEEGGTDAATFDAIMREAGGFRMGPFELMDLIGHDVNYSVTCSVFEAFYADKRFTPSLIQKELVDAGHLGRKSGQGFFDYPNDSSKMLINTASSERLPSPIVLYGISSLLDNTRQLLEQNSINYTFVANDQAYIMAGSCRIEICTGKTATQLSAESGTLNLALLDLTLDFLTSKRIAISHSDQCSEAAIRHAIGFFQALDKRVSIIDDIPGLCMTRTICMLANEGADTVNRGVCTAKAVDVAMLNGLNYPKGPLQWASELGLEYIVSVLGHLRDYYGEDRYRVSPLLQRKAFSGGSLYD